jgi:hypothetical protein
MQYYSMGNCRNGHCQYDHIVVDDESDKYTEATLVRDTKKCRTKNYIYPTRALAHLLTFH